MAQRFRTEVRDAFGKEYLKLFLLNNKDYEDIKLRLQSLESVSKINSDDDNKSLTVYPSTLHSIAEMETDIQTSLDKFYCDITSSVQELISIKDNLNSFEKTKKLYEDTVKNINQNGSNRETLDDLRLALELFLQECIGNKFTLEKQRKSVADYLKSRNATPEIKNSIINSLDSLYHFQDNYVKHDDNIKDEEVAFVIDTTNTIVKQMLRYKENNPLR